MKHRRRKDLRSTEVGEKLSSIYASIKVIRYLIDIMFPTPSSILVVAPSGYGKTRSRGMFYFDESIIRTWIYQLLSWGKLRFGQQHRRAGTIRLGGAAPCLPEKITQCPIA